MLIRYGEALTLIREHYVDFPVFPVIRSNGFYRATSLTPASRVRSLVPASIMSDVGDGVSALLGSTLFPELDPLDDAFGFVNMRVLPEYAKP